MAGRRKGGRAAGGGARARDSVPGWLLHAGLCS
jgi:hypothetical protein